MRIVQRNDMHLCMILFYCVSDRFTWTNPTVEHSETYLSKHFKHVDEATDRRFQPITLTGSGTRNGESGKAWRGINPTKSNRHWAIPGKVLERYGLSGESVSDRLDALDYAGLIYWPSKKDGIPRLKWFVDELEGASIPDNWSDIPPVASHAVERLGYPTQKPLALLKRIIAGSSNPGDVVLDPFCGCGTTIDAVETLNRENADEQPRVWLGIDITHLAINLIKHRLTRFDPPSEYMVVGEPRDLAGAAQLFTDDPFQFQFWACGLVGARPAGAKGGSKKGKKGADHGIDGVRHFIDGQRGAKAILIQVKGGKTGAADIRDFRGTLEREKAAMGIFITLKQPTKPMVTEAASAESFKPQGGEPVPSLQIVTIEQLLSSGTPRQPAHVLMPLGGLTAEHDRTVKRAKTHDEGGLFQATKTRKKR